VVEAMIGPRPPAARLGQRGLLQAEISGIPSKMTSQRGNAAPPPAEARS
jgi:hypothetical protein